jgi:hypothetical protein
LNKWDNHLNFDPIPVMLSTTNKALLYFIKRYLLEEDCGPIKSLWELQDAQKILNKQQEDGSWKYPGGKKEIRTPENYNLLETYRQLGFLTELFGFNKSHSSIQKAANYIFSFQTEEGDIRGIYGNQYSPNYTAAILELLIKTGYQKDRHIEKSLQWLLSTRQNDGGWAVPIRTNNANYKDVVNSKEVLEPNRNKPFSYMITGVVLRAFAAHPNYQNNSSVISAGKLLLSKFFESDNYLDRRDKSYWTKFTFPFWFTDLLSSLDSLFYLGFTNKQPQIQKALDWFKAKQQSNGGWSLKLLKGAKIQDYELWINYLICRTFKRYVS